MKDRFELTFTWDGTKRAELFFVLCNGQPIPFEANAVGRGKIVFRFERSAIASYHFRWGITFPGKELTNLAATVSLNGGASKKLGQKKPKSSDVWMDSGRVLP